jgi:hypothetical protein
MRGVRTVLVVLIGAAVGAWVQGTLLGPKVQADHSALQKRIDDLEARLNKRVGDLDAELAVVRERTRLQSAMAPSTESRTECPLPSKAGETCCLPEQLPRLLVSLDQARRAKEYEARLQNFAEHNSVDTRQLARLDAACAQLRATRDEIDARRHSRSYWSDEDKEVFEQAEKEAAAVTDLVLTEEQQKYFNTEWMCLGEPEHSLL